LVRATIQQQTPPQSNQVSGPNYTTISQQKQPGSSLNEKRC
jgi:hypothetical protein